MKTFLLNTLEKALNAYLNQDEASAKHLAKMAGKSISVELLPLSLHFTCHFTAQNVKVTMNEANPANTKIKGTPLQLLGAFIDKNNRKQFFADDLSIEGDAEFAQQVIDLFDQVNLDWEEIASRFVGDTPAYHLNKFVSKVQSWMKSTTSEFTQDVNDYLHEEKEWFPAREALQEFFSDIDTLRMDADRLEARIAHLKKGEAL